MENGKRRVEPFMFGVDTALLGWNAASRVLLVYLRPVPSISGEDKGKEYAKKAKGYIWLSKQSCGECPLRQEKVDGVKCSGIEDYGFVATVTAEGMLRMERWQALMAQGLCKPVIDS